MPRRGRGSPLTVVSVLAVAIGVSLLAFLVADRGIAAAKARRAGGRERRS